MQFIVPTAIGVLNGIILAYAGVEILSLTWWAVTIPVCLLAGVVSAKICKTG